jgi:hypothetical protein
MRNLVHLIIVILLLYTALVFNPFDIIDSNIKLSGYVFFIVFFSNWLIEFLSYSFQGCKLSINDGWKNTIIASQTAVISVVLLEQYYDTDDISIKYLLICTITFTLWMIYQGLSYILGVSNKCHK